MKRLTAVAQHIWGFGEKRFFAVGYQASIHLCSLATEIQGKLLVFGVAPQNSPLCPQMPHRDVTSILVGSGFSLAWHVKRDNTYFCRILINNGSIISCILYFPSSQIRQRHGFLSFLLITVFSCRDLVLSHL